MPVFILYGNLSDLESQIKQMRGLSSKMLYKAQFGVMLSDEMSQNFVKSFPLNESEPQLLLAHVVDGKLVKFGGVFG